MELRPVDSSIVAGTQLFCISWYTVACVLAGVVLVGVYDGFVFCVYIQILASILLFCFGWCTVALAGYSCLCWQVPSCVYKVVYSFVMVDIQLLSICTELFCAGRCTWFLHIGRYELAVVSLVC